jgi:hypothetical protein
LPLYERENRVTDELSVLTLKINFLTQGFTLGLLREFFELMFDTLAVEPAILRF